MTTVKEMENYLENYEFTTSNEMDSMMWMSKADMSSLARDYRKGDVYIYSKEEHLENLNNMLEDAKTCGYDNDVEQLEDEINEVKKSNDTVFITDQSDGIYSL